MVGFKVFFDVRNVIDVRNDSNVMNVMNDFDDFYDFCFLGFGYYSVAYVFGYVGADG